MDRKLAESSKVLIVDDHLLAQGYMKYSLQELGFRDITYEDTVQKAIRRIEDNRYDLIVCSYNLTKEDDGYHLYAQLKNNKTISASTTFIFISAETSAEIVHAVVELQPDDFLAKPFTVADLDKRLTRLLSRKKALRKVYLLLEGGAVQQALEEVESFLTDPKNSRYYPLALKVKGKLLLACDRPEDAKLFYQAILNVQDFSWAQIGMVNTLIKLNEDDEAEKLILRLAFKPDSQLLAYDLLSDLHIKQDNFNTALESVMMATEISPRNVHRHHKVVDLSRITHDYKAQFEAAKKIVKFSKDSVHDKPENYLNAARAGIDFAMTTDDKQTAELVFQASDYLRQYEHTFPEADVGDATKVINARMAYLKNDVNKAKALIEQIDDENLSGESMDNLLDKAKAFHELGLFEKSMNLLDEIEQRCQQDDSQGEVFMRYIQQEKHELAEIKSSPKDLNNTAVAHYQSGELDDALQVFRQAFTVMPKNSSIALNLLQAIAMKAKDHGIQDDSKSTMQNCIEAIENGHLDDEQQERYNKVRIFFEESA